MSTWPFYVMLVVLFALYLYFQAVPFLALLLGLLLFIVFVLLIVLEFAGSVEEEGLKSSAFEIVIAIVAVYAVLVCGKVSPSRGISS